MNMINDTQHRDTFSPLFMSTNSATSASVAQKRHHFDMKKQEAYVNLLTCLQTKQSATLITLVESKTLMEQNGVHVADGDLLRKLEPRWFSTPSSRCREWRVFSAPIQDWEGRRGRALPRPTL